MNRKVLDGVCLLFTETAAEAIKVQTDDISGDGGRAENQKLLKEDSLARR